MSDFDTTQDTARSTVPTPSAEFPGVAFEIHDKQQLELRFNFNIADEAQDYTINSYFFVPRNVGINPANYDKDKFYSAVTAHMRLDASPRKLERLANASLPDSPLYELSHALEVYRSGDIPDNADRLIARAKLFAYLFAGRVEKNSRRVRRRIKKLEKSKKSFDSIEEFVIAFLDDARKALSAFRQLARCLKPYLKGCHRSLEKAMRWADEYTSVVMEERLARVADALGTMRPVVDGTARVMRLQAQILELAADEYTYRKGQGYLVHDARDSKRNEYVTYRRSMLKKAIHQALYLDVRSVQKDRYWRNGIGAAAAGLAAVWAWATQVPATVANLSADAKMWMFGAAVIGYMAKDRIKAVSSEYITGKLLPYDKVSRVEGDGLSTFGLDMLRASLRERVQFVSHREIDPRAMSVRLQGQTLKDVDPGVNPEEIIQYQKVLRIDGGSARRESMLDIVRLNVRHFLHRLDDEVEPVSHYDARHQSFLTSQFPRVYHLNVVTHLCREDVHGKSERYDRFRVILSKHGIVRVSKLSHIKQV